MSSIQNFLNEAMTIDQQENSAEDNYNFEKSQLGEMYDEAKQQLLDSAIQSLPFGVAEASRGVGALWQTGKQIYAFKTKYSPQIEAFKAKAQSIYENIGKEGGAPVDYADLLKSAGTSLGKKALDLSAPEVLRRTGIDLHQAVNASKGEGGIEAGLADIKSQTLNLAKSKASGLVEEGVARAKEAVAPVINQINQITEPTKIANEPGVVGIGAEDARDPFTKVVGGGEIINPLYEGETGIGTHLNTLKDIASRATNTVLKNASQKALDINEELKQTKIKVYNDYSAKRTALENAHDEATTKLQTAQAKVQELQKNGGFKEVEGGNAMYGSGRSGVRTPGSRKPAIDTNPELLSAKAEVAQHTATLEGIKNQASDLLTSTKETVNNLKSTASESLNALKTTTQSALSGAFDVAKGVGGVALEGAGVYGGVEAVKDLVANKGNVGTQGGINDSANLYGGVRSTQGLVGKANDLITGLANKTQQTASDAIGKATGTASEAEQKLATELAAKTAEKTAVQTGEKVGVQTAEKVGVGLAETGAEIAGAEVGASAIPIVGEAIDIGLGLYSAIDSIINLFKKPPPPPPPPPPPQQQAIQINRQEGIF